MSGSVRKQIFLSALCLCVVCLLSSCYRLPQGERPFDNGPAKWVSKSGALWFEVTKDTVATDKNPLPILDGGILYDGKEYACKVMFNGYDDVFFWKKEDWEYIHERLEEENVTAFLKYVHNQNPVYDEVKENLMHGVCNFWPSKLVVYVCGDSKTGWYNQGAKYIFTRQPLEEEGAEDAEK